MPNLCKKEKGNVKNFNLKKKFLFFWIKNFFGIFFLKFFSLQINPKNNLKRKIFLQKIAKKILWYKFFTFFKLKFFSFPFSFSQRLGMNIKCPNVGYSKSISSGQYVFIFCVFSLSKISHFNMRHPVCMEVVTIIT